MPLTPEDGTGLATADTYITEAEYVAYAVDLGWILEGDNEVRLRRAFQGLNRYWRYSGSVLLATQAGEFPRLGTTAVPRAIKDAQAELAFLIQGGLDLFATVSPTTGGGKEKIKVGPIEIEESSAAGGDLSAIQVVAVDGLLRPYIYKASANAGRLVRG